jgi:ABC-type phosphate/phosphonate transport system substrate-binding protein
MDQRSMSGFVLPRALLRRHGVSPESTFTREKFLGSYPAMVKAVLDGKVDVSSTYASASSASAQRLGYADIAAERSAELTPLGFSPECPHDGIVLSPRITPDEAKEFAAAFERLMLDSAPAKVLCNALQVEGFDAPTPGKYAEMVSAFASEAPEGAH